MQNNDAYNPDGSGQGMPQGQNMGQNPYGQGSYEQAPYGQAPEQNPYGQPQGQNPYGQGQGYNPYGQNPNGQAPYGQNPYGQAPYKQPKQNPFVKIKQFFTSGKAGGRMPGVRQIIAAVLVFISLLFYLCGGWIKLPKTIDGESVDSYYSIMYPTVQSVLKNSTYRDYIQSELSSDGVKINVDKYADGILYMLKTIRDGKLSMGELAGNTRIISSFSKDLKLLQSVIGSEEDNEDYYDDSDSDYFDEESFEKENFSGSDLSDLSNLSDFYNLLEKMSKAVRTAAVLLTLLNVAVVLLAILAIVWILAGPSDQKNIAIIPYACSYVISFITAIVFVVKFNQSMISDGSAYAKEKSTLFSLGGAAIWGLIFLILACAV